MERSERGRNNFNEGADVDVFGIGRVHDIPFSMRVLKQLSGWRPEG
jgi:hypothetical protein